MDKKGFSSLPIIMGIAILTLAAIAILYANPSQKGAGLLKETFAGGIAGWNVSHTSNVPDRWYAEPLLDTGTQENFINIERTNSLDDGGTIGIVKDLNIDMSALAHLFLKMDVRVVSHSLKGSGFYDDTLPDEVGTGEYPLMVTLSYLDAGQKPQQYVWGFLDIKNINKKTNYDVAADGAWHTFVSSDLAGLPNKPAKITAISVNGRGWDFHGNVGEIELLADAPAASSLKFPPTISWRQLPQSPNPQPQQTITDILNTLTKTLAGCNQDISVWKQKFYMQGAKTVDQAAQDDLRSIVGNCSDNLQSVGISL